MFKLSAQGNVESKINGCSDFVVFVPMQMRGKEPILYKNKVQLKSSESLGSD